jgi:hypothetical protein
MILIWSSNEVCAVLPYAHLASSFNACQQRLLRPLTNIELWTGDYGPRLGGRVLLLVGDAPSRARLVECSMGGRGSLVGMSDACTIPHLGVAAMSLCIKLLFVCGGVCMLPSAGL